MTADPLPFTAIAPLGAFLFIGACELVPRSQALDTRLRTTLAGVIGMALMFGVTELAR